jgi:DNA-binding ferritin-like protein
VSTLSQNLINLLATLRAIRWHAWNTHWKAKGLTAYSDHLLFQRIYSGDGGGPKIDDQIDGLGERIIALFGNDAVDGVEVSKRANRIHQGVEGLGMIAGALELEQEALKAAATVAEKVSQGPAELRISLDNFVRELADARSTVIYLLQQRLKGGSDSYGELDLVPPVAVAGLVGLLVVGPLVVTPWVLKAFVPEWSYGRRVAAGFGISFVLGAANKLVRSAREPAPVVLETARTNNVLQFEQPPGPDNVYRLADPPDFGTLADAEVEADFAKTQRNSKILGWALLGLMGYVAYWNSQQPRRSMSQPYLPSASTTSARTESPGRQMEMKT